MSSSCKSRVHALLSFLDSSPSPFHAVESSRRLLEDAGFIRLSESDIWSTGLKLNGRYYFTRNGSSLVAFSVGGKFNAETGAINIVAAHTDSPCLRLKPLSKRRNKDGYLQSSVETYGGGLWHTWFDRDLGVAGRIVLRSQGLGGGDGMIEERLVGIHRPIFRVPTLAIHLDRTAHTEGFNFNRELQLSPILATEVMQVKAGTETLPTAVESAETHSALHLALEEALKGDAKLERGEEIIGFDLCLYDTQKATLGGIHSEYIQSARLDNLFMSFAALTAMIESRDSVENDANIRIVALFDNEEVGSQSLAGAESTLISSSITRILDSLQCRQHHEMILAKSFLISADMAHAVHPNYSDKHDECHRPMMQKGVVLKFNSNQRYTTNSRSAAIIKNLARRANVPLQEFMIRNDSPCGSTIGPILASQLGLQAVDVGAPQLSMHSIREMAGVADVDHSINLFIAFFQESRAPLRTLDMCK